MEQTKEIIIGNSRDYFFGRILPDNGICAEIGVRTGDNAERILNLSMPKQLYLIDCWDFTKSRCDNGEQMNKTYNPQEWFERISNKYGNRNNVEVLRKTSFEASQQFEDNYFDWAYIDAAHDYESVMEDCEVWWPKIKRGGFLCGHDYRGNVRKAVDDFIKKNNLELYYKGSESDNVSGDVSEWCIIPK